MHRFYIPDLPRDPMTLTLAGTEAAHAVKVLRVQPGEVVTALDGKGSRVLAVVQNVTRMRVDLEVQSIEKAMRPGWGITLFQAVTKPRSMDWIVEKATELGVHRVQPILTDRVVSRFDGGDALKKTQKWQRAATEALKQCGNLWLPDIGLPQTFVQAVGHMALQKHHLVASLSPKAGRLQQALDGLHLDFGGSAPLSIGVWVGPEGDFTAEENAMLLSAGAIAVTLGDHILRSETAALCAVCLIRYELDCRRECFRKAE